MAPADCHRFPELEHSFFTMPENRWRNRIKGRDWYDFEWFIRKNVSMDFAHFKERTIQSEGVEFVDLTPEQFKQLLKEKINSTNIEMVTADVRRFVINPQELDIWSTNYFLQITDDHKKFSSADGLSFFGKSGDQSPAVWLR
jgi:hypothetical protein